MSSLVYVVGSNPVLYFVFNLLKFQVH